jgi:hypothetical protein
VPRSPRLVRFPSKRGRFDDKKARQDQFAGACSYRQSAYTLPEQAPEANLQIRRGDHSIECPDQSNQRQPQGMNPAGRQESGLLRQARRDGRQLPKTR